MLPLSGFCKHAVWLFGVLVGLAIKEAITRVFPHLLSFDSDPHNLVWAEALRLVVFGLMIIRYYLGAAHLFDNVHAEALKVLETTTNDEKAAEKKRLKVAGRQFGVDFFSGLLHFTLFSVCSLTLELHPLVPGAHVVSEWAFRFLLLFILLYNLFWLAARPGPHPREVKVWTVLNTATAIFAASVFWYAWHFRGWTTVQAEYIPLLAVIAISFVDITQLTMGVDVFTQAVVVTIRYIGERLHALGGATEKVADTIDPPPRR